MFHRNVGGIDRAVRIVLGAALLAAGAYRWSGGLAYGLTLTIVGSIVLILAVVGYCPPYALFGFSTARPKEPAGLRAERRAEGI